MPETAQQPVILHSTQGLPPEIVEAFGPAMSGWNREIVQQRKSAEQLFVELDVRPGDRVRLRQAARPMNTCAPVVKADGAVLEGVVKRVKRGRTDGKWKIQIEGFDTSGNGVFWNVSDYVVEVLHQVYRLTEEDLLIVELANLSVKRWQDFTDAQRASYRTSYAARAARVKALLGQK